MEQYAEDLIRAVSLAISFCAFFFGVPGNALVIHIIRTHPKFRTVHNIFHANLALADLTTCGIGVPVFLATRYISPGDFRDYSCRFSAAIAGAYNFMNICMLMSISIIRVHAVQRQKQSMSKKTAIVILVLFWILSISIFFVVFPRDDGIFVKSCKSREDVPDLRGILPYIFLFVFVPALVVLLITCTCSYGYLTIKARRMRNFIHPITHWSSSVHFINTPHDPGAHYYRNTQYDLSRQHEMTNDVRNAPLAAHFISDMAMTSSILTAIYLLSTVPFLVLSVSQIWFTISPSIVELCYVPSFCSMFLNPYIFASRHNTFKESFSRTIIQILQ
ncbi:somatostatin receptor type 2-like [Lingula anatina]|uniref:Somatostatin receptor type 2-like n=1 Tax=Lingula anatina TaxID=7574 RepID=A0A2R2MS42_LINAN|nr:somatostatin receptor type 2-like [Lingula anatina]|eukprot:XP_023933081.1 somatostatin receptor type 2-like [Lingula anatina]